MKMLKQDKEFKKINNELKKKREPYYPLLMMTSPIVVRYDLIIEKLVELIEKDSSIQCNNEDEPFSDPVIKVINEVIHFINFNRKYRKNVDNAGRPTFSNYVEYLFMQLEKYIDDFSALHMNYRIIKNEEVKELYDVSILSEEEISKFPYQ